MPALHKTTIEELEHKRSTARDECSVPDQHDPEDLAEWRATLAQCDAVLANPTHETLRANPKAMEELDNALTIMLANVRSTHGPQARDLQRSIAAVNADLDVADR